VDVQCRARPAMFHGAPGIGQNAVRAVSTWSAAPDCVPRAIVQQPVGQFRHPAKRRRKRACTSGWRAKNLSFRETWRVNRASAARLGAIFFHAAEGRIGEDDVHAIARTVIAVGLGQGVVVPDTRALLLLDEGEFGVERWKVDAVSG
jgi:hypothetical protein